MPSGWAIDTPNHLHFRGRDFFDDFLFTGEVVGGSSTGVGPTERDLERVTRPWNSGSKAESSLDPEAGGLRSRKF